MSRAGHSVLWAGLQQGRDRHRISLPSPERGDLLTPRVYMQDTRGAPTSPEDTVDFTPSHIFNIKTLYLFSLKDIVQESSYNRSKNLLVALSQLVQSHPVPAKPPTLTRNVKSMHK